MSELYHDVPEFDEERTPEFGEECAQCGKLMIDCDCSADDELYPEGPTEKPAPEKKPHE